MRTRRAKRRGRSWSSTARPAFDADRCAAPAGLGEAVLFCTRERLVRVGGVYGLQPVKHGLSEVTSGIRYAMGLPFHEFR